MKVAQLGGSIPEEFKRPPELDLSLTLQSNLNGQMVAGEEALAK